MEKFDDKTYMKANVPKGERESVSVWKKLHTNTHTSTKICDKIIAQLGYRTDKFVFHSLRVFD